MLQPVDAAGAATFLVLFFAAFFFLGAAFLTAFFAVFFFAAFFFLGAAFLTAFFFAAFLGAAFLTAFFTAFFLGAAFLGAAFFAAFFFAAISIHLNYLPRTHLVLRPLACQTAAVL